MNYDYRYGLRPETGFPNVFFGEAVEPPAPFRRVAENDLERLKHRLLRERLAETNNTNLIAPMRRAANEAAALAWLEPLPLLVFPSLFEEKVARARLREQKQQWVTARSAAYVEAMA